MICGNGVDIDAQGTIYVIGDTTSSDFPVLNGVQAANHAMQDIFVAKLSSTGSLIYSTYLGGHNDDHGSAIKVDASGNVFLTGSTMSIDFPVSTGAFQTHNAGGQDAFVAKLNATATTLLYSTYLGGSGGTASLPETGSAIAIDSDGDAYVTGTTSSTNFPVVNPLQGALDGSLDAFVVKLNPSGRALIYSTYIGGSGVDIATGIALGADRSASIAGYTSSTDFPTMNLLQPSNAGMYDAFVATIAPSGSGLIFSTYIGGTGSDSANAVLIDSSGNLYAAGQTQSVDFPVYQGVQTTNPGNYAGFVTKISDPVVPAIILTSPTAGTGYTQTFTFTFGDANGYSDIGQIYLFFNSTFNGFKSCYITYVRATNTIGLLNDSANAYSVATLPSATTLQNTQCSLNVGAS